MRWNILLPRNRHLHILHLGIAMQTEPRCQRQKHRPPCLSFFEWGIENTALIHARTHLIQRIRGILGVKKIKQGKGFDGIHLHHGRDLPRAMMYFLKDANSLQRRIRHKIVFGIKVSSRFAHKIVQVCLHFRCPPL